MMEEGVKGGVSAGDDLTVMV